MFLLNVEGASCPWRAIREWLCNTDNVEHILKTGFGMPVNRPMEIEVWKAMDDILSIPPKVGQDILVDPSYDAWYVPKFERMMVKKNRRVSGYPIPMGQTLDETAKIMSGAKKYLILHMWYVYENGGGNHA